MKHGRKLSIVNLYTGDVGNPCLPKKLKTDAPDTVRKSYRWAKIWITLFALVALLVTALFFVYRKSPAPLEKSIAVLPFQNLSDNKENAYFAGGIQDDVLTNLAKIGDLKVISRTSVMQYEANPRPVREIGKELGVAFVLEGSVPRSGNRMRLNVQLINATTDEHVWAEDFDRELTDVFAIQSDLAFQIASTLHTKLSAEEKTRLQQRPTENPEAYLIYLQAQDRLTRPQSDKELEKIADLYAKAVQLDPTFALAFARLSYVEGTRYQGTGDFSVLERSRAAADEALRLQPALPEAHLALGYFYYRGSRDYDRALQELGIAKAGLPNDPEILLVIGSIERRQGKWSQSTADLEKAASINPKSAFLWTNVAINHQSMRNYSSAEKAFERGIAADPNFFMNQCLRARLDIDWKGETDRMERLLNQIPENSGTDGNVTLARFQLKILQRRYVDALEVLRKSPTDRFSEWRGGALLPKSVLLAQAYQYLNDKAEARTCFEEAKRLIETAIKENPLDASRHALLGQIYAGLGRENDAIREGKRAVELLPEMKDALDGPVMSLALAQIYTIVGDLDSAIPLLEHSLVTPGGITLPALRLDPVWDPLRKHPLFKQIVATIIFKQQ